MAHLVGCGSLLWRQQRGRGLVEKKTVLMEREQRDRQVVGMKCVRLKIFKEFG